MAGKAELTDPREREGWVPWPVCHLQACFSHFLSPSPSPSLHVHMHMPKLWPVPADRAACPKKATELPCSSWPVPQHPPPTTASFPPGPGDTNLALSQSCLGSEGSGVRRGHRRVPSASPGQAPSLGLGAELGQKGMGQVEGRKGEKKGKERSQPRKRQEKLSRPESPGSSEFRGNGPCDPVLGQRIPRAAPPVLHSTGYTVPRDLHGPTVDGEAETWSGM